MKIGIISPSEIAFRRFLPALMKFEGFEYAGVAVPSKVDWFGNDGATKDFTPIQDSEYSKALGFKENYGGEIFDGYSSLIEDPEIEALYIPLPPGLHYKWTKKALEAGKHVFVEKPATCSLSDTRDLITTASEKGLALHENYMFMYHKQIEEVDEIIKSGGIGEVRNIRLCFGFPKRSPNDFRYNKSLGGGALFDAGGYTLRYARHLLGPSARIISAAKTRADDMDIDIAGGAMLTNDSGVIVHVSFGMDNDYRCLIDAWGSKATLTSVRIFTAPVGFTPTYVISTNGQHEEHTLSADDAFLKSIEVFHRCIVDEEFRRKEYKVVLTQAEMVDNFLKIS